MGSLLDLACDGFEPTLEAVRGRGARQAKAEARLRVHPEHRYAFEVADAPLKAGAPRTAATTAPAAPVSVVLAVRHGGQILFGEILIEQWDPGAFVATLGPASTAGEGAP